MLMQFSQISFSEIWELENKKWEYYEPNEEKIKEIHKKENK